MVSSRSVRLVTWLAANLLIVGFGFITFSSGLIGQAYAEDDAEASSEEIIRNIEQLVERLAEQTEETPLEAEQATKLADLGRQLNGIPTSDSAPIVDAAQDFIGLLAGYTGPVEAIELTLLDLDEQTWAVLNTMPKTASTVRGRVELLAPRLTTWIGGVSSGFDQDTRTSIEGSLTGLFGPITLALRDGHIAELTKEYAVQLEQMFTSVPNSYIPSFVYSEIVDDLTKISEAVGLALRGEPRATFATNANTLLGLIDIEGKTGQQLAEINQQRVSISSDPAAMVARGRLLEVLPGLLDRTGPRIHVLSATFGDLRPGVSETRQCDATSAVIRACQAQQTCASQGGDVALNTEVNLCGYNPIPRADVQTKLLSIQYACIDASREYWDLLTRNPWIHPVTGDEWEVSDPNIATTTYLLNERWTIRCSVDEAALFRGVQ